MRCSSCDAIWWLALAIAPNYRDDGLLENVLVSIAVPMLAVTWRHLSRAALTAVMLFLFLHAIGAQRNYAQVPYARWAQALIGRSLNESIGLQRSHFDRLAHFQYGLLSTLALVELIDRNGVARWHWLLPFACMASHAVIYEVIAVIWCLLHVRRMRLATWVPGHFRRGRGHASMTIQAGVSASRGLRNTLRT